MMAFRPMPHPGNQPNELERLRTIFARCDRLARMGRRVMTPAQRHLLLHVAFHTWRRLHELGDTTPIPDWAQPE